ncbi:MAG: XisH family protein [Calothrix sp. FI2-JRJ7]|nr:XisH family protein [Calothrix sp. FI2-JRJ7]
MGKVINLVVDDPERILYLAVPLSAYNKFFTRPFVQIIIQNN